jgi:hypothetical protein
VARTCRGVENEPMSNVEELSRAILRKLVRDFLSQNLDARDLSEGYGGPGLAALKQECCAEASASPVDFDLALKDLEDGDFIGTGPMVPFDNPPNSHFLVVGLRSKYEFAYLTEKGYKAAQKVPSKRGTLPVTHQVHISGGHFHQSPIGVGDRITQSVSVALNSAPVFVDLRQAVEKSGIGTEDQRTLLAGVDAMEKAHNMPGFIDRYKDFIALAANHMTIVAPFLPALSSLLSGSH